MRKIALLGLGLVVAALVALGLVVLSSASQANALHIHGNIYYFIERQMIYVGVGLLLGTFFALVDYRFWRRNAVFVWVALAIVVVLLLAVFLYDPVKGSRRWIKLGFFNLQPGELAKLMMVFVMALCMDLAAYRISSAKFGLLIPAGLFAALAGPVVLEPDFGSTLVIGAVGLLVMFVAGVRFMHLGVLALIGATGLGIKVAMNANRMARIAAWQGTKLNVGAAVADKATDAAGYQVYNALVAIKNGGLWGVGLTNSMQKQYYLPEAHTDFIFAIGAEELGLCYFTLPVIILFILLFICCVHIALKARDRFGRFLVVGMTFVIFFPAMFNLGVVCQAYPTKGMALPFFSYGGTNMLSAFVAVGVIMSVGYSTYKESRRRPRGASAA